MKQPLPYTHWTVRATSLIQVLGSLIGIYVGIDSMGTASFSGKIFCGLFMLLYLGIGIAAAALWFGAERGLHWTRLLLILQVPFIKFAAFSYMFYSGAIGLLYVGRQFGIQGYIGSSFQFSFQPAASSDGSFAVGVNVLAIAMLAVLKRVDLIFVQPPPQLARMPPAGDQ